MIFDDMFRVLEQIILEYQSKSNIFFRVLEQDIFRVTEQIFFKVSEPNYFQSIRAKVKVYKISFS